MLVAERYENIVHMVNTRGSIRVTELSEMYEVTAETIRRDLDKLESDGKLVRSHGGAIRIQDPNSESPFYEREAIHVEEKRKIANEAVKFIQPNDRIILDGSTSAWYMSSILPNTSLTVLTNSIKVAMELSSKKNIKVFSTGGFLSTRSLSFVGPLAERSLEQYHVDKAFISCQGVHIEKGISEPGDLQARLKQKMASLADQVFLMVDYSKFGVRYFASVPMWNEIDYVITDSKTENNIIKQLKAIPVQVVQAG